MTARILIAGIGNIFHGDDAFGVRVAQQLLADGAPADTRVLDIGIRAIDLAFALLDPYDLVILIDATQRGQAPGSLYTIEITPEDIPDATEGRSMVNAHALEPVHVLALAKSIGAPLGKILLVACEPEVLDNADTGHIGLSEAIEAAVAPVIEIIRSLVGSALVEVVTT